MRLVICCILLSFLSLYSYAQEYSFVQYSVSEGLPQTQVYALSADDDGYVWFGTAGGTAKFNGIEFESYSTANGLADNVVSEILHYRGFTWIFTNTGVTRIKGKDVKQYNLKTLVKGSYISAASFRSETNSLILASKSHQLFEVSIDEKSSLDTTSSKHILEDVSFSNIRNLLEDKEGKLWVLSNGKFGYLDLQNNWIQKNILNSQLNISDMIQLHSGDFAVSVYGEGVYIWNNEIIQNFNTNNGLVSSLIRSVFEDSEGRLWLASKVGVSVIDEGVISIFNLTNGLPNENIETICEDAEGNIWLASDGSGAFRFTSDEFVTYHAQNGLGTEYVMSITQDAGGNRWFGTYGSGIVKLDQKGIFHHYNLENNKINNNIIWSSYSDSKNRLWFGSSDGLVLFENDAITNFLNEEWLPSNKITSIYENSERSEIWFGTSKGLGIHSPDSSFGISTNDNFILKNIRTIEKGVKNQIWLGTSTGLVVSDGSFFEPWIYNDQLPDKVIYCIKNYKDSVWFIGTGNGLYYTDGITVEKMQLHQSFGANFINFLEVEADKYLWVGTNNGIFEININTYLKNQTQGILHHTQNSGLTSVETNLNAAFVDSENRVWMGTGNGLVRFDRSKRRNTTSKLTPKVNLKEIQLFLKPTEWKNYSKDIDVYNELPNELSLSSKNNYLTFYFEGISLSHPEELMYKIMLEGLDEEFTPPIYQNSFTYPSLSYGNYTFKVKASIDGIHWSEPSIFSFEIRKPYYLTWWFIAFLSLLFVTIVYVIFIWRQNIIKRRRDTEQLVYKSRLLALEQQTLNASMNRHFIFNALNSIQYYINTQDRLSANRYLTSFAKLIRKNLDSSVSDTGLVTLADELDRLELYISLEHMRFQEKFTYEIIVAPDVDREGILIPAMILQPFVENSIWHGLLPKEDGGKISVNIYNKDNSVIFEIQDNGIGIEESLKNKTANSHHSKGMLITSGRIDILKKVNQKKMSIRGPFQINGEGGKPMGTKVILKLENGIE